VAAIRASFNPLTLRAYPGGRIETIRIAFLVACYKDFVN